MGGYLACQGAGTEKLVWLQHGGERSVERNETENQRWLGPDHIKHCRLLLGYTNGLGFGEVSQPTPKQAPLIEGTAVCSYLGLPLKREKNFLLGLCLEKI